MRTIVSCHVEHARMPHAIFSLSLHTDSVHPSLLFCLRPSAFLHPTNQSTPTPLSSTNVHLLSLRGSQHTRVPLLFLFLLATVSDGHPRNCLLGFRVSTWYPVIAGTSLFDVGQSKKKSQPLSPVCPGRSRANETVRPSDATIDRTCQQRLPCTQRFQVIVSTVVMWSPGAAASASGVDLSVGCDRISEEASQGTDSSFW